MVIAKVIGVITKRTEKIWLKQSNELSILCHISKNLYNEATYIIRQEFFETGKWVRYNDLAFQLKTSKNYKQLPAQTSQQILKVVDCNWKSFFRAIKVWKKHPERFHTIPRLPKYKKKDGEFMLIFTNQQAKIKNGVLILPKKGSVIGEIKTRIENLMEVRILPRPIGYVLEIVYEKTVNIPKRDKTRIAGIDLGLRNLVTIGNNIGEKPIIVKGKTVKNINQYFNKKNANLKSVYDLQGIKTGIKAKKLFVKRNKKIHDYLHKVSRCVVDYLVENDIGKLIIGHNDNWKQNSNIGRRNNQNFVGIPFYKFTHMIQYKAEEHGIEVIYQEESHTSKCSFFDNETIKHHDKYIGKRKRGLFRTAKGFVVNSDVNGALNIIKKAVPNAFEKLNADRMEDAVSHPSRLGLFNLEKIKIGGF